MGLIEESQPTRAIGPQYVKISYIYSIYDEKCDKIHKIHEKKEKLIENVNRVTVRVG